MFCSTIHTQDSKKISEKYFPDFDIEVPTPAFNKKKGFTKHSEMMYFLEELCKKYPNKVSYKFIGKSQKEKQIPMVYLGENKVDNLDAKIWQVEANSTANLKVMSNDIHILYQKSNIISEIENLDKQSAETLKEIKKLL